MAYLERVKLLGIFMAACMCASFTDGFLLTLYNHKGAFYGPSGH